jgi:outer membrane cobalamin receptor
MRATLIFFAALFSITCFGQDAIFSGIITSAATGEKLPGVIVMANSKQGAVSDTNGFYKLELTSGTHTIVFKLLGFETVSINISLAEGESQIKNISLRQTSRELGVVVVSAGRFEQKLEDVTVSMNVIKPALVENKNTTSMEDIINQIPGVDVTDAQANIRGGSGWSYGAGSRVLMLVDDVPLLAADANDVKWSFIPLENIGQIEVIKGASSASFGSSALNGVINFRTAYPKDTPVTKATLYTGIYDTPKRKELKWWGDDSRMTSGYSLFHSRKLGQSDIVAAANYFNDDGYRQGETEERFRFNVNYRYRFKKTDGLSVGIKSNIMQAHTGTFFIWADDSTGTLRPLGGLDTATTTITVGNNTRFSIDPFFSYVSNSGISHKLNTRYFLTINENDQEQGSAARLYFAEYQFQKKFKDVVTATIGVTDVYSDIKSELYEGNHTGNNFAMFAQADIKYKKISFSLGGRMEKSRVDTAEGDFTPVLRMGINYHVAKETYLRASYGQGYRFPSVAEKYVSTEVGGVRVYPNDSLQPERGWSAEIGVMQGIKIGEWNGYFDIAFFQTEYNDMMEFTFGQFGAPVFPTFGLGFKSQNIGDTRIKGIDVSLSGEGKISGIEIKILAGYTFIDPRQINFDLAVDTISNVLKENLLKYRYRHSFKGDIEMTVKKISIGASARYNSFMENIDRLFNVGIVDVLTGNTLLPAMKEYREEHSKGNLIFDFRLSCGISQGLKASFLVNNALNTEYVGRPYDMQPPRTFTLQFSLSL